MGSTPHANVLVSGPGQAPLPMCTFGGGFCHASRHKGLSPNRRGFGRGCGAGCPEMSGLPSSPQKLLATEGMSAAHSGKQRREILMEAPLSPPAEGPSAAATRRTAR